MMLFIDNYDSFTFNIVQAFQALGLEKIKVIRNNTLSVKDCLQLKPGYLVIGPGPGNPSQAGISKDLILASLGKVPILGICLGHQSIAEVFGGAVIRARIPMHGKISCISHDGRGIFAGLPQKFSAARYHSLIVEKSSLPSCLEICAETEDGEIMGLRHREFPLEGVQFHPESVLSQEGPRLLENFINLKV